MKLKWEYAIYNEYWELDNELDRMLWAYGQLKINLYATLRNIKELENKSLVDRQKEHFKTLWNSKQEFLKRIKPMLSTEFVDLWAKPTHKYMYRYPEISKIVGVCNRNKDNRKCLRVEFNDGEIDYIPLISEGKEWEYCDRFGSVF